MLAGHYGPAYALKARFPEVPLWSLFLFVQITDILFFSLALFDIEGLEVHPGEHGPLAMRLVHIPYTHSLLLNVLYVGILIGGGYLLRRPKTGIALGLALFSHWLLDVPVHLHDLPLLWRDEPTVGFALWESPMLGYALELGILATGYSILRSRTSPSSARRWLDASFLILLIMQTNYVFTPGATSRFQMAAGAGVVYFGMVFLAFLVDGRLRRSVEPGGEAR